MESPAEGAIVEADHVIDGVPAAPGEEADEVPGGVAETGVAEVDDAGEAALVFEEVHKAEVVVDEVGWRGEAVAGVAGEAAIDGDAQGGGEAGEDAHADRFEPIGGIGALVEDVVGEGRLERLRHLLNGNVVEGGEELADVAGDVPAAGSEERLSPQRLTLDGGIAREGASPHSPTHWATGTGAGRLGAISGRRRSSRVRRPASAAVRGKRKTRSPWAKVQYDQPCLRGRTGASPRSGKVV